MSSHSHVVPDYQRTRRVAMNLTHKLVASLDRDVIDEAGGRLGVLEGGKLVLDSEDQVFVVMDYAIYNVYRGGRNAVERMLADAPPSSPEELALLRSMTGAYYSIFQVVEVERGAGVTVKDLLRKGEIFVVDVGLGTTAKPGYGLAGRVIPLPGYVMTGGALLPFDKRAAWRIDDDMKRWIAAGTDFAHLAPDQEAELAAQVIRACLQSGASERIRFASLGEANHPGRSLSATAGRVRANRNDPCPCGSGRKYKSCCGKR